MSERRQDDGIGAMFFFLILLAIGWTVTTYLTIEKIDRIEKRLSAIENSLSGKAEE